ncbi:E3 ubiquitin ligase family protein [Halosolutus amylolyticus]|uniref:RING-type E3 ubiquitin transferase n=1 Tax=Halosolutus amylolyticus TaxID=2932267 RepID=A0ABD5PR60_9EURY|nr:E3 ubiquitin ligase family protein [Halosolutus amylolyticus]
MVAPSPSPVALVGLVVVAAGTLLALVYGVRELRLASHVLRSRPDAVLDAPDGGPIQLRGTAKPAGGRVRSPFTDTSCLASEYVVEEARDSKHGRSWTTIASGERYVPFRLDDGSGSVLIEPPGADFRLEEHARIDVDGGRAPPEPIRAFIDRTEDVDSQNRRLDLRLFELRTGTDRRFRERVLEPGEEILVLGTARYDTTVSRRSGEVNAAVGIDERVLSDSRWIRLRHRLFGYPFVVSDSTERRLGLRAGLRGGGAVVAAVAVIGLAIAWVL